MPVALSSVLACLACCEPLRSACCACLPACLPHHLSRSCLPAPNKHVPCSPSPASLPAGAEPRRRADERGSSSSGRPHITAVERGSSSSRPHTSTPERGGGSSRHYTTTPKRGGGSSRHHAPRSRRELRREVEAGLRGVTAHASECHVPARRQSGKEQPRSGLDEMYIMQQAVHACGVTVSAG